MAVCVHAADPPVDPARDIERLYRSGDVALATQRLDTALAAQPGSPRLLFLRGVILSETRHESDAMAVFDHFKRVDEDTVMGIMNGKLEVAFGTADPYYFWLEREQA